MQCIENNSGLQCAICHLLLCISKQLPFRLKLTLSRAVSYFSHSRHSNYYWGQTNNISLTTRRDSTRRTCELWERNSFWHHADMCICGCSVRADGRMRFLEIDELWTRDESHKSRKFSTFFIFISSSSLSPESRNAIFVRSHFHVMCKKFTHFISFVLFISASCIWDRSLARMKTNTEKTVFYTHNSILMMSLLAVVRSENLDHETRKQFFIIVQFINKDEWVDHVSACYMMTRQRRSKWKRGEEFKWKFFSITKKEQSFSLWK